MSIRITAVVASLIVAASAEAAFINGDFESGNTGFSSGYNFVPYPGQVTEGSYTVASAVPPSYWDWVPFHDVSGSGNMLIVNGGPGPTVPVWSQAVSVTPNTTYAISYYLAEISTAQISDALIAVLINGVSVGSPASVHVMNQWTMQTLPWNSGAATTATVSFVDLNNEYWCNDFALDNISMAPVPEPSTVVAGALLLLPFGLSAVRRFWKGRSEFEPAVHQLKRGREGHPRSAE